MAGHWHREERKALRVSAGMYGNLFVFVVQQEARLEHQEQRLHDKAVNAALHGNIGKAISLEVSTFNVTAHTNSRHRRLKPRASITKLNMLDTGQTWFMMSPTTIMAAITMVIMTSIMAAIMTSIMTSIMAAIMTSIMAAITVMVSTMYHHQLRW